MGDITFLSMLGLIWGFQSLLCAAEQDTIVEKKVIYEQRVNLTCQVNSSGVVTWMYSLIESDYYSAIGTIAICTYPDRQCVEPVEGGGRLPEFDFQAIRTNETSILSLTATKDEPNLLCKLGEDLLRTYKLTSIDPSYIDPICTVTLPNKDENGVVGLALSCEVYSVGLEAILSFEGMGLNIPDAPWSPQSAWNKTSRAETLYFDSFNNVHNASCSAYFPDILTNQSCSFPNIIKTQYTVDENSIIVECGDELDFDWHLLDSDGREEDIQIRSWTREGGRSLLILGISEQDVGKVVVCKTKGDNVTNGTIFFTVISNISGDINESNSEDPEPPPSAHDPFLVLTLLFLALWLITTAVCGVWLWSRSKWNKSFTSASGNTSGPHSRLNQSSNEEPNLNGGGDESEMHFVNVRTEARGNADRLNTNNSAHNSDFQLEENGRDESNRNRQSNNESHLYFTLEQSFPSKESLRRDRHGDTNSASLQQPQSSHWQGYELVEGSNKGATCSHDLGEYAEVGDHLVGRCYPDQSDRPPMIRQKPGIEEVKEDDMSRLYSKVNK